MNFLQMFFKRQSDGTTDAPESEQPEENGVEQYQKPQTITQAYQNPLYQGKIVIESPEGLYSTTKEENAVKKLDHLHKKYESEHIITTVIPKGVMGPAAKNGGNG